MLSSVAIALGLLLFSFCSGQFLDTIEPTNVLETTCFPSTNGRSLYNFTYKSLSDNATVNVSSYRNKILLIVNVASFCDFTYQYLQLNEIKQKYQDALEILAFPCNQFWKQEPGINSYEIYNSLKYVRPGFGYVPNFPLSEKIDVNGPDQNQLYGFLKQSCPAPRSGFVQKDRLFYDPLHIRDIRWNFEKFLIAPKTGMPYKRYDPKVEPRDLIKDIELLKSKL